MDEVLHLLTESELQEVDWGGWWGHTVQGGQILMLHALCVQWHKVNIFVY